jgi:hypothetical protein
MPSAAKAAVIVTVRDGLKAVPGVSTFSGLQRLFANQQPSCVVSGHGLSHAVTIA